MNKGKKIQNNQKKKIRRNKRTRETTDGLSQQWKSSKRITKKMEQKNAYTKRKMGVEKEKEHEEQMKK